MKVGIFDPYLKTIGGGERYVLTIGSYLSKKGSVDVFGGNKKLKKEISARLNLDLERVNFEKSFFSLPERISRLPDYDLFFYVTDGSFFWPLARKNIAIVQSPSILELSSRLDKFKLLFWKKKLCYSQYVADWLFKKYKVNAEVLSPPVDVSIFRPLRKKNHILSVGRFAALPHGKKQEVFVSVFKEMCDEGLLGWKLRLVGGADERGKNLASVLRKEAQGYPIEILPNASFSRVKKLYGEAKIYWHGAGFGEDLEKFPERAEHFGITTVEAMASGCVPVVFKAGGQTEIVEGGKSGFFWRTRKELGEKTYQLIRNEEGLKKLSGQAQQRSRDFSQEKFYQRLDEAVK